MNLRLVAEANEARKKEESKTMGTDLKIVAFKVNFCHPGSIH